MVLQIRVFPDIGRVELFVECLFVLWIPGSLRAQVTVLLRDEGLLLSLYNQHAHMQTTIPVVYQFKQWKQDILHPVSVLPTGTVCEQ